MGVFFGIVSFCWLAAQVLFFVAAYRTSQGTTEEGVSRGEIRTEVRKMSTTNLHAERTKSVSKSRVKRMLTMKPKIGAPASNEDESARVTTQTASTPGMPRQFTRGCARRPALVFQVR